MKRNRKVCHQSEDQYGDFGTSQDRHEYYHTAARGGGGAGGFVNKERDVTFTPYVPKFLQKHKQPAQPKIENLEEISDNDEEVDRQEAINVALEEDPSLAKELNESVVNRAKAGKEKELGNQAFKKGDLEKAVQHYSTCIELDPMNEVYYSNRSSAYCGLKDFAKAVRDAETVIRMKPQWVKGWARLAVAYYGLEQYSHSKDAYDRAIKLEPHDASLTTGREKAEEQERLQMGQNKHTFNKARKRPRTAPSKSRGSKNKGCLSFDDDGF